MDPSHGSGLNVPPSLKPKGSSNDPGMVSRDDLEDDNSPQDTSGTNDGPNNANGNKGNSNPMGPTNNPGTTDGGPADNPESSNIGADTPTGPARISNDLSETDLKTMMDSAKKISPRQYGN